MFFCVFQRFFENLAICYKKKVYESWCNVRRLWVSNTGCYAYVTKNLACAFVFIYFWLFSDFRTTLEDESYYCGKGLGKEKWASG